jgi:hypothetical protein
MESGFAIDQGHGTSTVSHWVEGAPEKSMWTGLKTRGRRQLPVETWRCTRCGWLDSYAAG